jgi:hypothetical protein
MLFAAELLPIEPAELLRTTWLYLALWAVALATTSRAAVRGGLAGVGRERSTVLILATLVSIAFLGLALVSARRAMVQWVAFGFLTLPLAWTLVDAKLNGPTRRAVLGGLAIVVAGHLTWGAWRHRLNVDLVAFDGHSLAEPAAFLAANSAPGDIVFHARWDNFGPLLAHDRVNRYLGGMDPIFQFAHDPRAYWEFFYLSADVNTEWTCDAFPCAAGVATDTYLALRDHFDARWVLVEPRRNPRLTLFFLNDPRFRLALETQREAVFELLRNPPAPISPEGR